MFFNCIDLFCNITNASLKSWSLTISPSSSPSIPSFSSYNRTKKRTANIHSNKCLLTLHDGSLIRLGFIISYFSKSPSFHKFVTLKHFTSFSNYLHHRHHILKKYIKSLITHTRTHTHTHTLNIFLYLLSDIFLFIFFFFQHVQQKMSIHP